jgi:flagellar protein FlaH
MAKTLSLYLRRDELNRNFGGGLPQGSIILIEGRDGAGKSILAQRFAYGLLENGSTVTYISSELSLRGFIEQMNSVDYKVTDKILDEKLLFIPLFPQIGNVRLKKNFLEDLLKSKKLFESDVVIFDTLSFLLINDEVAKENGFELASFIKRISTLSKTILFTLSDEQVNPRFLSILRSMADVYLQIEAKSILGNLRRIITVIRFNKSAGEVTPTTAFKVIPNQGLAIEIASLS